MSQPDNSANAEPQSQFVCKVVPWRPNLPFFNAQTHAAAEEFHARDPHERTVWAPTDFWQKHKERVERAHPGAEPAELDYSSGLVNPVKDLRKREKGAQDTDEPKRKK